MVKEQFTEYNGIKVGDIVAISKSLGECYTTFEEWLDEFNLDKRGWHRGIPNPPKNTLGVVLAIAKHLYYGEDGDPRHKDILFYINSGTQKYIMSVNGIEPLHKEEKKSKNYCTKNGKQIIYYIID